MTALKYAYAVHSTCAKTGKVFKPLVFRSSSEDVARKNAEAQAELMRWSGHYAEARVEKVEE